MMVMKGEKRMWSIIRAFTYIQYCIGARCIHMNVLSSVHVSPG